MPRPEVPNSKSQTTRTTQPFQNGSGVIDVAGKVAQVISNLSSLYTSEQGTALRNMIPASSETARPGFAGEKHALLRVGSSVGVANFMGPGTQIEQRILRGDPPRTASDKVAQAHDLRYALARTDADTRAADKKMVSKLKQIQSAGEDSRVNTTVGMKAIEAKMKLENMGLVKRDTFATKGGIKEENRGMLQKKLSELEQEGYGSVVEAIKSAKCEDCDESEDELSPADKLKLEAMGILKSGSRKRGKGLSKKQDGGAWLTIAKFLAGIVVPKLINKIKTHLGKGHKTMYGKGMAQDLSNKLKDVLKGLQNNPMAMADKASKVLLPELYKIITGQVKINEIPKNLYEELKRALHKAIQNKLNNNQSGEGFWSDFAKGFVKGFVGTAKTLLPLAPLLLV